MFYDIYCDLCAQKGLTPSGAAAQIGFNRATVSAWKREQSTPNNILLKKIADYFGVTTDYLLTGEQKEKAPTPEGEREITFDDFTYAMQNESKELTDEDKQILLSLAKQLNDARKKRNGESR